MIVARKDILLRILVAVALAAAALALFVMNRNLGTMTPEESELEFASSVVNIDREVEEVLEQFGVERAWIRRKEIGSADNQFVRVERVVSIPPDIIPAVMNRELNIIAWRYRGRAVATENQKENSVTIHILIHDIIVQTVILKIRPELQRKEKRARLEKV